MPENEAALARHICLEDLPYDLWPLILAHFPSGWRRLPRDVVALSSTCRTLRSAVQPTLFSRVTFSGPLGSGGRWADFLSYQLERFDSDPSLYQYVRAYEVIGWHNPKDDWTGLEEYTSIKDLPKQGLLDSVFRLLVLLPNVTRILLRSVMVPDAFFQHLRHSIVTDIRVLFCDFRGVSSSYFSGRAAFKDLRAFRFQDFWWNSGFSMNDLVGARNLKSADFLHNDDFRSPFPLCTVVSHATEIRIYLPQSFRAGEIEEFLAAFPRVTTLFVRGDPFPASFDLPSELLPQLSELNGLFSATTAVFVGRRPVKSVRLYQPPDQETSIEVAQALSAGLLLSTAPVEHIEICALRLADYFLVLPAFRANFRLVRKLHLVSDDDDTGLLLLEWMTREMGSNLLVLESLIIGNEHLFPNRGLFTRITPVRPDTTSCLAHVLAFSESCPHLRYILLPGLSFTYRARGDWVPRVEALDDTGLLQPSAPF